METSASEDLRASKMERIIWPHANTALLFFVEAHADHRRKKERSHEANLPGMTESSFGGSCIISSIPTWGYKISVRATGGGGGMIVTAL